MASNVNLCLGDCLEVMATMESDSIDSVVTDPPYGLSFMGKNWDHGIPDVPFWEAALRVAKPGAMLLAFGGTRTFHRLTVAIEDAGWEIRDCLMWLTGQGFPKGHDIYKNMSAKTCKCTGSALPYSHYDNTTEQATQYTVRPMRQADLPQTVNASDERGQVLQPFMPEQSPQGDRPAPRTGYEDGKESSLEGRGDIFQEEGQLQEHSLRESAGMGKADGTTGRLHNGASASNGAGSGPIVGTNGGGTSPQPRPDRQQAGEPGTVAEQQRTQEGRRWKLCPRCGKPVVSPQFVESYRGFNTALKPSFEPIIMARKPLQGTVAANVLTWGCGGINVDGCRIGYAYDGERDFLNKRSGSSETTIWGKHERIKLEQSPQGRWPANLLLDEGAAAMLDEQSGPCKTGGAGFTRKNNNSSVYSGPASSQDRATVGYEDTATGASRFFYVAKASKRDRDEGLEGMEERPKPSDGHGNSEDDPISIALGSKRTSRNFHPTVKPTALMRYLVRLVTPKGGVVLDPFLGSGSTLKAAVLEGFGGIGIDNEAEYLVIAEKRIEYAQAQMQQLLLEAAG